MRLAENSPPDPKPPSVEFPLSSLEHQLLNTKVVWTLYEPDHPSARGSNYQQPISTTHHMASKNQNSSTTTTVNAPPPAPPLPPLQRTETNTRIALKVRSAPPPWIQSADPRPPPPAGIYFFYGTLQDPGILSEVLSLDHPPKLKSARLVGYGLRLWGQYPALVRSITVIDDVVCGCMYEVESEGAAARLAEYETKAYRPLACSILGEGGDVVDGYAFVYDGNPEELSEGLFELEVWLKRMGRVKNT
jgi:hypothetical protein